MPSINTSRTHEVLPSEFVPITSLDGRLTQLLSCARKDGIGGLVRAMLRLPKILTGHPAVSKLRTYTLLGAAAGGALIAVVTFAQENSGTDVVKVMPAQ